MFALDDRTGNVLTTIAVFAAVGAIVVAAKTIIIVFVVALLFAYLLEPMIARVEGWLPARPSSRAMAIATVYTAGALLLAAAGYTLARPLSAQAGRITMATTRVDERFAEPGLVREHAASINAAVQRAAHGAVQAIEETAWLLLVPLIAVFFLSHRAAMLDGAVDLFARRRDRASVKRTVAQVDGMLAQYARAQLLLSALTFAVYAGSMAILGFPAPVALGLIGGVFELIPIVGWIMAAAIIVASGWLAQAPWIWMACVIGVWRVVQNVVNAPRIMGNKLQLDPLSVLFASMIGGQLGGLLGALLSVPVVAVAHIIWLERTSGQKKAAA